MNNFLMVFFGGGLGAVLRYSVALLGKRVFAGNLWASTLIVNVIGSFIFLYLFKYHKDLGEPTQLLLKVGLLGGLTTFSSLSFEVYESFIAGDLSKALLILSLNIIMGIVVGIIIFR